MANFPGGSAWAMVRDIGNGHQLVTERTFLSLNAGQLNKIAFELDRHLREVRSDQPPLEDVKAQRERHRKISRINSALTILKNVRMRRGRGGV